MQSRTIIFIEVVVNALKIMLRTKKLSNEDFKVLMNEIKLNINDFDMTTDAKRFFYLIFSNKEANPISIDISTLKKIFHLFYEKCCEFIGPVDTDKIISVAIQKASEKDEALDFDPRELLRN